MTAAAATLPLQTRSWWGATVVLACPLLVSCSDDASTSAEAVGETPKNCEPGVVRQPIVGVNATPQLLPLTSGETRAIVSISIPPRDERAPDNIGPTLVVLGSPDDLNVPQEPADQAWLHPELDGAIHRCYPSPGKHNCVREAFGLHVSGALPAPSMPSRCGLQANATTAGVVSPDGQLRGIFS